MPNLQAQPTEPRGLHRKATREYARIPSFSISAGVFSQRDELIKVLSTLHKDRGAIVKTTKTATVGGAAAAVQACKDAGLDKVSYVPES